MHFHLVNKQYQSFVCMDFPWKYIIFQIFRSQYDFQRVATRQHYTFCYNAHHIFGNTGTWCNIHLFLCTFITMPPFVCLEIGLSHLGEQTTQSRTGGILHQCFIKHWFCGPAASITLLGILTSLAYRRIYRKTSSISRTKSQSLNVYCILLQLSSLNPLKPGVKLRMKM